ncbi:peptidylprolyl isomerase [Paenibacillus pini]|uniref:Peptidyl-prolyl cis-trans isomerase n=1 Tax=Paenibacillus pini JCM 16418 TaxID=1236976 RepID=W7Z5L2_9BACL|nr:peptidylprolyl isomerase [Paenibacillus pini]GAF09584.1 peptidyl-prolyl cis-trans isomerase [Paenibacillus pini JCM 16418]
MKFKYLSLPVITLVAAALIVGGCGNNDKKTAAEDKAETGTTTETGSGSETQAGTGSETKTPAQTEDVNKKSWDKPPAMEIDKTKNYEAEVKTSKGSFTIELYAKDAPKTVNNFVFLAKQGFYDGVIFHRIIESFMIQTGDPEGTGMGGPGYSFEDEKTTYKYEPGIVAMANAGPNTNGSQFFICTGDDSMGLNSQPNYTIFGKITKGMDVVKKIAATPVEVANGEQSHPTEKITMDQITITQK